MTLQQTYYRYLAWKAVNRHENLAYAVVTEFWTRHKDPPYRFIIYPQMLLKWKPNIPQDSRREVSDFGIVNLTYESFKIRCGVEVKRATHIMKEMPEPKHIIDTLEVRTAFFGARGQAVDQAKAAFKNGLCFDPKQPIWWMLVVGPYWTPVQLGPFTEAELTVRSHKKSPSEDFRARLKLTMQEEQPPPPLDELYCFASQASHQRIEQILQETDEVGMKLAENMMQRCIC
jgi:hypothetical protein